VAAPVFEIDSRNIPAQLSGIETVGTPEKLPSGVVEHRFRGNLAGESVLSLMLIFRVADGCPVVRFRYELHSSQPRRLTKVKSQDSLTYTELAIPDRAKLRQVCISDFDETAHSYVLNERPVPSEDGETAFGPILTAQCGDLILLLAYEHGSTPPDEFVGFEIDRGRIRIRAVEANYSAGQVIDQAHPFETIWLELAVANDMAALAEQYRRFVLNCLCVQSASRRPYIFYNTWAFQERNKWHNGKKYLDSMTQERILAEIDVAYRMGVDVFVLDTGWYEKTGDWRVNSRRFDENLKTVRDALEQRGMKLGLWFGPLHAAVSSRMYEQHRDCVMSQNGVECRPFKVWETEESVNLCLVSCYADAFADELIRLYRELGVTYFKLDAVGQFGCDSPNHCHGNASHSPRERMMRYGFELPRSMVRVVERLQQACPEAIVDFDVTENGRAVGLAFLSAGKYFLINNGPYYDNFNVPVPKTQWTNIFVHPGPARTWICRKPLALDQWIPSVLFLTHYLPDDPRESQLVNIASLVLGQNGIWGDLLNVSSEGVELFGRILGLYKQVRDDITQASPVQLGSPGTSPEVHEKISAAGRGAVVVFANRPGVYRHRITRPVSRPCWCSEGCEVSFDARGRAQMEMKFEKAGAKIAFFGLKHES
jgi:alpha-galactosidase